MTAIIPNDTFREIRRKKVSRQQLATLLETSTTNIDRWERGELWPEPVMLGRLCTFFEMSPEELGFSVGARTSPASVSPSPIYDPAIPLLPAVPLIGRAYELFQIKQRLKGSRIATKARPYDAWTAVNGMPGVGKTALAVELAHDTEIRGHFCDGILWSNLALEAPLLDILHRWGLLLGISEVQLATLNDVPSLVAALRIAVGNRKMLLVIDDVCKLEDVLTLGGIGGPNCAYFVTTRFAHIATHVALGGTIQLRELQEEESVELLRFLAPRVVDAEPDRVRELVHSVDGLPLALVLLGNYLRIQTANKVPRRITAILERLRQPNERLQVCELHSPIEKVPGLRNGALLSLQSAIAVSDQLLSSSARATLYALSILPPKPQSFSREVALTVASCAPEDLDSLYDVGMVERQGDRYMLHRVVADYARLQLRGQTEQDAVGRLVTYVSKYVEANEKEYDLLEVEGEIIRVALDLAYSHAYWEVLTGIACSFCPFLIIRGLYEEAESYLQWAYSAVGVLGAVRDPYAHIRLLSYLGEVAQKRGQLARAEEYFQRGLESAHTAVDGSLELPSEGTNLAVAAGWPRLLDNNLSDNNLSDNRPPLDEYICDLLKKLGWVVGMRGDYAQAHMYLQECLQLVRQIGDNERLCGVLSVFGSVLVMQGEYGQADVYLLEGLSLARQIGDRLQTCALLINKGLMCRSLGDFLHAEEAFHEGLFHARQLGHREWISLLLTNLGDVAREHDDYQLAEKYVQEALELVRAMDQRELLCMALVNLAAVARKQENYVQAYAYLEEGLVLSRQIEQPLVGASVLYEYAELHFDLQLIQEAKELFLTMSRIIPRGSRELLALARYGLARTLAAQGNLSKACEFGMRSAEMFEIMQHRKAQEVRLWVDDLRDALTS